MLRILCRTSTQVTINASPSVSERRAPLATHASNHLQVAVGVSSQHLDCDLQAAMFALPYIRKSATVVRDARWIVA